MAATLHTVCCYGCGNTSLDSIFRYSEPPVGETVFSFSHSDQYSREILQCTRCGHFQSSHEMDTSEMYSAEYVDSTYGASGMLATYEKIIQLPRSRSDNWGRCARVHSFAEQHFGKTLKGRTILDVGSGLCVFLQRMRELGWQGTALDPDERAARHAREVVGVDAICGDFFETQLEEPFDVLTLNKVLEHVEDPVAMLAKASCLVQDDGFVYVEVPDGEFAARDGKGREEFFIEHLHVFSMVSTQLVCQRAGFDVVSLERLQEPSTKYTIRAFLRKRIDDK